MLPAGYACVLAGIKDRVRAAQLGAAAAVNREFPKMAGFSRFSLYRTRMFFQAYAPADAIVAQPVQQLPATIPP